MHNNYRLHVAHVVQEYLAREIIQLMNWSIRSRDLNRIEQTWNEFRIRISARQAQLQRFHELVLHSI